MDFSRSFFKSALATVVLAAVSGPVFADSDQEGNYYLEQMKAMSKSKQASPADDNQGNDDDLLAESDLKNLSKPEEDMAEMKKVKPKLDKPALPDFKKSQ